MDRREDCSAVPERSFIVNNLELKTHLSDPSSTSTGSAGTSTNTSMSRPRRGRLAAAGLASAALVLAAAGTAGAATTTTSTTTPPSGGSLSGPADGGSTGIIDSTSASAFTITTATGLQVNITETSSTKVVGGPASAVRKGTSVLVLGLDDSTSTPSTITASAVVIQPFGDGGAAAAALDGVIPFSAGTTGSTKVVGTIPSDYTEGDGTIISGAAAFAAAAVAQAVYPGGVNDRVVQLSDGSYEVHDIGVNWPHHVFVSKTFKVTGAND
jgi:hypothetical protein